MKKSQKINMDILDRLAKSKFRGKFRHSAKDIKYIKDKGLYTIYSHACDFIRDRVAPSEKNFSYVPFVSISKNESISVFVYYGAAFRIKRK